MCAFNFAVVSGIKLTPILMKVVPFHNSFTLLMQSASLPVYFLLSSFTASVPDRLCLQFHSVYFTVY